MEKDRFHILVTGGAGFIGSHIVDELLKLDQKVIVLDDLSGGFRENIHPQARFIKGNVADGRLVSAVFAKNKIDYVFHLAAYAAENLSHHIKRFNYENNLIGSVNLINAAVNYGVKCFVFTSSAAVYGKNKPPIDEETLPIPGDPYGVAKLAVEQELKLSHEFFDLNYIIFRPHNVYGERQNIWDKYRNVIGIFINQALTGKPLTVFGNGRQTRPFTYIGDVAPVIARSIFVKKAYNQVFNIGANKAYSIGQIVNVLSRQLGIKPEIFYTEARKEVNHINVSHERIANHLQYRPRHSLEEGLTRMIAWARTTQPKKIKSFKNIEIRKNLPVLWA